MRAQPFQTFVKTITRSSASGLNIPIALSKSVQAQFISDFSSVHGVGQILFVGKYEQYSITQFVFVQHTLQFVTGFADTYRIVTVDDKDDTLGILEVVAPQGTNFILTSDVPYGETDVFVFDGFDVEA